MDEIYQKLRGKEYRERGQGRFLVSLSAFSCPIILLSAPTAQISFSWWNFCLH